MRDRLRRVGALIRKESLQTLRDPSSLVVGVLLPALLLTIFGYGVSLDAKHLRVGVVVDQPTPDAERFVGALRGSGYFDVSQATDRTAFLSQLSASHLDGVVILAPDFSQRLARGDSAGIQVITDGSDPNTAGLATSYVQGVWQVWQQQRASDAGVTAAPAISVESRFWFNPQLESRQFLVPGSMALILMMIGALLTALVVAREWEVGTIEALLATPVGMGEFIVGKLVPNFLLGMGALAVTVAAARLMFDVPLRGSLLVLVGFTAVFMLVALGLGLLVSTLTRTQFLASQIAMLIAFLPNFYFSGFLFEVASMPAPLRALSVAVPARYYVRGIQTIFLAGNIPGVLIPCTATLAAMGALVYFVTLKKSKQRLD
jgi:ABC-2 type transport system permease protein